MTEIKIDPTTLPKDGQKVRWQTYSDQNKGEWKTGVYADDNGYGLFLYNVREDGTTSNWDLMWDVFHWEEIMFNNN